MCVCVCVCVLHTIEIIKEGNTTKNDDDEDVNGHNVVDK